MARKGLLVSALALLIVLSLPVLAQTHAKPFNATAVGFFIYVGPDLHATTMGSGIGTELGKYTWVMEFDNTFPAPPSLPSFEGILYSVAANGDLLVFGVNGTATPTSDPDVQQINASTQILGAMSTGRFAGASGDGTFSGPGSFSKGTVGPLVWTGTISR